MKKISLLIMALGIMSFSPTLQANAIVQNNTEERGSVSVVTSANTEIAPDVVDVSFAVKTVDNKSMQKAAQMNKEISAKLYSALAEELNTKNGDYIKTSDYNAYPVYSYSGSKKNFEKYEVTNKVIIHTKSIDSLGKIIDKAILAGATNVDSLVFSLSNYENECDNLIGNATKKAQKRADVIAKNLMTSVSGVKTLNASCSMNNHSMPRVYMSKAFGMDAQNETESFSTPLNKGVVKIYANVNASFFIK